MSAEETSPLLRSASPKKRQVSPTPSVAIGSVSDASPRTWLKWSSFACSLHNCLWAGSILLFSLWSPIFQQKLGYTQLQVNAVAVGAELGEYLPVPIFGYIADHYGPSRLSLLAGFVFMVSYGLASWAFATGASCGVMVGAFFGVGMGTTSMHFAGLTASAKNFGGRGLAIALPITGFGLGTFWQSQVITKLFRNEEGELMVSNVFMTYAVCLAIVGVIGFLGLAVVVDEPVAQEEETEVDGAQEVEVEEKRWINAETRRFLCDQTTWWFALGVFLTTGPGESFINNMGSLIQTISSPEPSISGAKINPANHVSIIALSSALARIFAGAISDYFAPRQVDDDIIVDSESSRRRVQPEQRKTKFECSRLWFVFLFALLMACGQLFVASGYVFSHPEAFWFVSALEGASYGAMFTLIPAITAVVWGTKNFGTNLGIMFVVPAVGAAVYGAIWGAGYDGAADEGGMCWGPKCATASFALMAASTMFSLLVFLWAWRGLGGWKSKGVVV